MCWRVITHYMHHDVAAAVIVDPLAAPGTATEYANPHRTPFHRCELPAPGRAPRPPLRKCTYHTCCLVYIRVDHCTYLLPSNNSGDNNNRSINNDDNNDSNSAGGDGSGSGGRRRGAVAPNPEACELFALIHHHERLPYFGVSDAYVGPAVPATWRGLARLRADWLPTGFFAHDAGRRAAWERRCLAACERLCRVARDAVTLRTAAREVDAGAVAVVAGAERTVAERAALAEDTLAEQRDVVLRLFRWAGTPCAGGPAGCCRCDFPDV
ncbi:hypothetical protein SAMD00023353_9600160 [Rosellinia necatrix]|uniref:Uncharacterized protein n=1 Tax=Rosellinia necatrix TaxID=77044 RepID=A0A1S8ABF7_ROSNE|nr:hypothetical protein SAMD00023353_9600160 [Rosellinia necatrix]